MTTAHHKEVGGLLRQLERPIDNLLASLIELEIEGLPTYKRGIQLTLGNLELYQEHIEGSEALYHNLEALAATRKVLASIQQAEDHLAKLYECLKRGRG